MFSITNLCDTSAVSLSLRADYPVHSSSIAAPLITRTQQGCTIHELPHIKKSNVIQQVAFQLTQSQALCFENKNEKLHCSFFVVLRPTPPSFYLFLFNKSIYVLFLSSLRYKVKVTLSQVRRHEDISCLTKYHAMKTYEGVEV
jgi:hypothetical protein